MMVIRTKNELQKHLESQRLTGKTIGFVPTMGALHPGHLSLVTEAEKTTDYIVVSIFVNPTQFNNPDDLKHYPRTLQKDLDLLGKVKNCCVFAPEVEEMYPEAEKSEYDFGVLETVMEGKHRPGHFKGVAQIVSKLFDNVQPNKTFFGEKDFQQLAIIREMSRRAYHDIEIIACPTIRENDGLAMSSRNMRLNADQRKNAPLIYQTLKEAIDMKASNSVSFVTNYVINKINNNDYLCTEYFEIVDRDSLQAVKDWNESEHLVGCIAVFCGEVRLIDNIKIK